MLDLLIEKINELSMGGISGISTLLFLIIAIFGFIKGAVRLIFLVCILGGAGFAAYWGSENGLAFIRQYWAQAPDLAGTTLAVICGLIAFFILFKIFNFLVHPFENNNFISRFGFGIPSLVVSTSIAALIAWAGFYQLQKYGAQQELKYWLSQDSNQPQKNYPALARLKQKLAHSSLGKTINGLYQSEDTYKYNLAKIIVIANTSAKKYNQLAKDKQVRKILRHPEVRKLIAASPEIQKGIANNDPKPLLTNPAFLKLLKDPDFLKDLSAISADLLEGSR